MPVILGKSYVNCEKKVIQKSMAPEALKMIVTAKRSFRTSWFQNGAASEVLKKVNL